jgi:mRNA interferase MazF
MPRVNRGEIWQVDLGLAAKIRPCLILSRYPADDELALLVIIPHTTSVRGNRWEYDANLPFLERGVFHLQQIQPISLPRLERRLGQMPLDKFAILQRKLIQELQLQT